MSDYNRVENIRPQDTYSEFGYSRHNDSYSMSQSLFSERPESFFPQNRYGINDNRTVTRNKVGFFKSKMIITKDNDY